MSSNEQVLNTGQQATTNYDVSKIFLWNNRFESGEVQNSTYDDLTLPMGRLMGRVTITGKLKAHNSSNTDGSEYPIGVLNQEHIIEAGETKTVSICISGDVAEEKVVLYGSDLMSTAVDGRQIRDRIQSDSVGIILRTTDELTGYDN